MKYLISKEMSWLYFRLMSYGYPRLNFYKLDMPHKLSNVRTTVER
jgi:hypothetical protein